MRFGGWDAQRPHTALNSLIAEERRIRIAAADDVDGEFHQVRRRSLVPAYANRRIDQSRPPQALEAQVGQFVSDIVAFGIAPAHHHRHCQTVRYEVVDEQV